MRLETNKDDNHIYNLFFQNFLITDLKYSFQSQDKDLLNFPKYLRMVGLKTIL